jgi:hypothetical protein
MFKAAAHEARDLYVPVSALAKAGEGMAALASGDDGIDDALQIFAEAGKLFTDLGWESGASDVSQSIADIFARADGKRRIHLVSRVLKEQEKFLMSGAIEACRRHQIAERKGLEPDEMTQLTLRQALTNYEGRDHSSYEVAQVFYTLADNLARIRTGESELLVLFRTLLHNTGHHLSASSRSHLLEAYYAEEIRLSVAVQPIAPHEPSNELMRWRDETDTEILLGLLQQNEWAPSLSLALSRVEAMRVGEYPLFTLGGALRTLGLLLLIAGELVEAEEYLQQSILACLGASDIPGEMQSLLVMERVAIELGDTEKARHCRVHIERLAQNLSVPAYA